MRRAIVLFLSAVVVACSGTSPVKDRQDLTAAELAFADTMATSGQRAAWLVWFAPDGVMFSPGPVNAREYMRSDPIPEPAPPGAFDWRPTFGGIAASGDLGYNTGPVKGQGADRSSAFFFSIWRKQPNGDWRVAVDLGTSVDLAGHDPFDDPFQSAPPVRAVRSWASESVDLNQLEEQASGSVGAFMNFLADDARGLRPATPPLAGRDEFERYLADHPADATWSPMGFGFSKARDLAFTYGAYRASSPVPESGHYARVWRRDTAGAWKIAFDIARPVPGGR